VRHNGGTGRRPIKGLGAVPGTARVFGFGLQIAPRQIHAHGVAVNGMVRLLRGNVGTPATHGDDQFDFVMQIVGGQWVGYLCADDVLIVVSIIIATTHTISVIVVVVIIMVIPTYHHHEARGRLGKEKGRFAIRMATHFNGVICVIATDAINAMHGKLQLWLR